MKHGEIRPCGNDEPDVELHLRVFRVEGVGPSLRVEVKDMRDFDAAPVWLWDRDIDYREKLAENSKNIFYVPLKLAKEKGLCEKCFGAPVVGRPPVSGQEEKPARI